MLKAVVFQADLNAAAVKPLPPQAHRNAVGKQRDAGAYLVPGREVFSKGHGIAHGFDALTLLLAQDARAVQTVCIAVKLDSQLAHQCFKHFFAASGKLADGSDAVFFQKLLCGAADIEQRAHREGPDDLPPVFR